MRLMLIAIILAAIGWSGYWFVGARAVGHNTAAWFTSQPDAEYEALTLRGFPNRFDLTVTGPQLAEPVRGLGWSAPFLQVFALSYRPHHVIAVWPHEQSLHLPGETVMLGSADLRASLVVSPDDNLALDRATLVGNGLRLVSDLGWSARAEELRAALRRNGESTHSHDFAVELTGLAPELGLMALLDPSGQLPARIDMLRLDLTTELDRPLDRHAAQHPPQLTGFVLHEARLDWGETRLRLAGAVQIDRLGLASGGLTLTAEGWEALTAGLEASGLLDARTAAWLNLGLAGLEPTEEGAVEMPLTLRNGVLWFGPMALAELPPLNGF